MKKTEVKTTRDHEGKEVLTILNDDGEAISLTMESIFDNREVGELDATAILSTPQLEELKHPPKSRTRLEVFPGYLVNKETGIMYPVKYGNIPKKINKDVAGVFFTVVDESTGQEINVIVPVKLDGTIPEAFPYALIRKENS